MTKRGKELTLEDELFRVGILFLFLGGMGIFVAVKWILPIFPKMDCFFWQLFGIYCPGCGGTRAVLALLEGHILESLWYHPIVMYAVLVFGWFMLSQTLERIHVPHVRGMKFHEWHLYGALVLIAVNFVVKNILYLGFGIAL